MTTIVLYAVVGNLKLLIAALTALVFGLMLYFITVPTDEELFRQ